MCAHDRRCIIQYYHQVGGIRCAGMLGFDFSVFCDCWGWLYWILNALSDFVYDWSHNHVYMLVKWHKVGTGNIVPSYQYHCSKNTLFWSILVILWVNMVYDIKQWIINSVYFAYCNKFIQLTNQLIILRKSYFYYKEAVSIQLTWPTKFER